MSPTTIMALGLGLAIGVLLALLIDGQYLVKRVQTAVSEQSRLQKKLGSVTQKLQASARTLTQTKATAKQLNERLRQTKTQVEQQEFHASELQQQLAASAAEIEVLHGNLNRVMEHADGLQEMVNQLKDELETAVSDNETFQEQVAQLENDLDTLNREAEAAYQEIAINEVEMRHVQEKLTNAQSRADLATKLEMEKHALCAKIDAADAQARELKAQLSKALDRLMETDALRQEIKRAREGTETAVSKLAALKANYNNIEKQLAYSEKHQLQLIRGIGPTYAKRLAEMGIHTFTDLAQQEPDRIIEIVKLRAWQNHDPIVWIEEARRLANPE